MRLMRAGKKPIGFARCLFPVLLFCSGAAFSSGPWEWSGHLTLTSDYVNRGVSQTSEEAAIQGSISVASPHLFAGLWASSSEYPLRPLAPRLSRDWEVVYYGGYRRTIAQRLTAEVQLSHYTFPGADLPRSQDYTEYALRLDYRNRITMIASYTAELLDLDASAFWLEVTGRHALPGAWLLSASLGFSEIDQFSSENFRFANLGVSRAWGRFSLDVRAHATDGAGKRRFGNNAGERLVVSLSMGF